jgi:hypothetical protein
MKPWKLAVVVGALAVVGLLAAVAIASGADRMIGNGAVCDGDGVGTRAADGTGAGGRGFGGSEEMQAWRDQYGADPDSAEAQAALDLLRTQYQARERSSDDGTYDCDGTGAGYGRGAGMMGGGNGW